MEKIASQLMEKITDFVKENPKLITGLAATGGAGALAGAAMTNTDDKNESGSSRFLRRLKNALLVGGLAAGAGGAAAYGIDKFKTALPEGDVAPASKALHSNLVRALGALGLGSAGAGISARNKQKALDTVFGEGKMTKDRLAELLTNYGSKGNKEIEALRKAWGDNPKAIGNWLNNEVGLDTSDIKFKNSVPDEIKNSLGVNANKELGAKVEGFLNDKGMNVSEALKDVIKNNKGIGNFKFNSIPGINNAAEATNPENIAKLLRAAGRNKLALGAGAAGVLLPEAISGMGSAIGSLFGGSLYD